MAEYIDRDKVLDYRETVITDDYSGNETYDVVLTEDILGLTPADVIERSKIDKTIEDIKELYTEWENLSDDAKLESNPFGAALNILQRNIGE